MCVCACVLVGRVSKSGRTGSVRRNHYERAGGCVSEWEGGGGGRWGEVSTQGPHGRLRLWLELL